MTPMVVKAARKLERGQALPLLVLVLIGLAAFAALALDGGNLWTEQRRAQAAADNAVMAAAYQQMQGFSGANLSTAAFATAAQNGYAPGPATKIDFHQPPVDGAYAGDSNYMEVVITQTVPTALAHLIYRQDPIPLTVRAVAHGIPSRPPMAGYALAAMFPDCTGPSTIYLTGRGGGSSGGTFLTGGGAFVNGNCPDALNMTGSHEKLMVIGSRIDITGSDYNGTVCTSPDPSAKCNYYPAPTTNVPRVPQDPLRGTLADTPPTQQDCGPTRDLATELADPVGIHPGTYTTLDSGHADLNMRPGIYCLSGGTLSSQGSVNGNGVMIYLVDTAATINFSGTGSLNLTAPEAGASTATPQEPGGCRGTADPTQDICKYLGFVVYKLTGANTCLQKDVEIDFTGDSSMNVIGLVYAPYSLVRYGGIGSLTMTGQTIAGCVKFNGNGSINIIYNPNATFSPAPWVRLDQ